MSKHVQLKRINNKATILVEGDIDPYWTNQEYFRFMLSEVDTEEEIEIRINSKGGDPNTALQIYAMLKNHPGKVTAYIEFMCASAVTIVAAGADEVVIANIGWYMIHRVGGGGEFKDADDADRWAKIMRATEDTIVSIYKEKTGLSENELRDMIANETWMTAQEALSKGFVDRIETVVPMLANKSQEQFQLAAHFKNVPKELTNNGQSADETPNKKTIMDLTNKLKGFFGLSNDADEADVAISAKELKNKADSLQGEVDTLKAELEEKKTKLDEQEQKITELESAQTSAEEKAAEQEDEELEQVLENAVKEFKIKASAKDDLKTKFKDDLTGLENMLEAIPGGKPGKEGKPNPPKMKNSGRALKPHDAVSKYFKN